MVKLWKPKKMFPSSETSIVPPVLIAPYWLGMAISRSFLPSKEYSAISEQALRLCTARMPSSVKPTLVQRRIHFRQRDGKAIDQRIFPLDVFGGDGQRMTHRRILVRAEIAACVSFHRYTQRSPCRYSRRVALPVAVQIQHERIAVIDLDAEEASAFRRGAYADKDRVIRINASSVWFTSLCQSKRCTRLMFRLFCVSTTALE